MDPQRLLAAKSTDLLALIRRDTELVRIAGTLGGEWAGPCPFCGGTDRLHVNPTRPGGARWYCRQCTPRGGDAIDYVQRRNSLSFGEAVERLADAAGALPAAIERVSLVRPAEKHAWQRSNWQRGARMIVDRAAAELAGGEGEAGRRYLRARGLDPITWTGWRLGYTCAWHPVRQLGLPALTLPWIEGGAVHAIQYRFLPQDYVPSASDPDLTKGERFSQRAGSERTLFGLDLLAGQRDGLVLVEGELNAVSIWQVWRERADVLSWGPQGNILRPLVLEQATRITARYARVLLWADEPELAAQAAAALPIGKRGLSVHSVNGLDANDRLCQGDLAAYLDATLDA